MCASPQDDRNIKQKERCLNVILVGEPTVGKTAIIRRYVN